MEWYTGVIKKYAEFGGRARRQEYWMFVLINALIAMGIGIVEAAAGLASETGGGPLSGLYGLFILIPGLAVAIRRLHDTGRSGWWLLMALIPLIGWVFVLVALVKDSDPGINTYGPSPKYGTAEATPAAAQVAPAGWLPDPMKRHDLRYWDGAVWTEHVSDAGVVGEDPLG
jgi:uncharacterized membrane protein YhaH (DUF805 family)